MGTTIGNYKVHDKYVFVDFLTLILADDFLFLLILWLHVEHCEKKEENTSYFENSDGRCFQNHVLRKMFLTRDNRTSTVSKI